MNNETSADTGTSMDDSSAAQPASSNPAASNSASVASASENVSSSPTTEDTSQEQAGNEWQTKYSSLEKNYNELRRKLSEQGTERNEFRKNFETLQSQQKQIAEALAKATQTPYDPDAFMEGLRAQGPEFLHAQLAKHLDEIKNGYTSKATEQDQMIKQLTFEILTMQRRSDEANYPDFAKMEQEMIKAYQKGGLPFDPEKLSPTELVDSLYNFVKLQHSQDALKAAEQHGKNKAEEELAREASTSVAGGGKKVSSQVPDFSKMTLAQERAYWVGKIGEAG